MVLSFYVGKNFEFFQLLIDSGADLSLNLGDTSLVHLILCVSSVPKEENMAFARKALDKVLLHKCVLYAFFLSFQLYF